MNKHKVRCDRCTELLSPWKRETHVCKVDNVVPQIPPDSREQIRTFQDDTVFQPNYSGVRKKQTIEILNAHWSAIKNFALYRKYSKVYNLRIENNNINATVRNENVKSIFHEQTHAFKVQASAGFVLLNSKDEQLRYWHSSTGVDALFDQPILIQNFSDFQAFIEEITQKDFIDKVTQARPNTEWSLHLLTNLTFFVYPIPEHPIGCPTLLEQAVKNNKAILAGDCDSNGRPYSNNLCFFRALAYSRKQEATLERSTKTHFYSYLTRYGILEDQYDGISMSELPKLERHFETSVNVFTLETHNSQTTAKLLYRATTNYKEKLNLHVQNMHFSLIKNLPLYTRTYKCQYCNRLLKSLCALNRHTSSCSSVTKSVYPTGVYTTPKTIFEKLGDVGVLVDESRKHYPYLAVFDSESFASRENLPSPTKTITWETEHVLASVSVCSNIAGFREPKTFLNDTNDPYSVVSRMMSYLDQLSEICYERLLARYADVFDQLKTAKREASERELFASNAEGAEIVEKQFDRLEGELDCYLRDLLVFGFNSKAYDIPLMKRHIIRYLVENDGRVKCVIKKTSQYMMIQTEKLRFLDITNFLPQGFSLAEYLKAMEVETGKFWWIHDRFTSMSVLARTDFPRHEEFYSQLKRSNISEAEYLECKKVWNDRGMTSLRDMLIYYNECDVVPLVTAIEKQNEFFKSKNLDFKAAMSVPGMAIRHLFELKDPEAPIFLFGNRFKDVHELIRKNIRGGLSLVFCRYQCAEKTKIKSEFFGDQAKTTASCFGFDCTSLYLKNLGFSDLPTGAFVRRRRENGFRLEKSYQHGEMATKWIEYMSQKLGVRFQHMFNGVEKRVGGRNIPVDGFGIDASGREIVLNFSGCYFHSHMCELCPNGKYTDATANLKTQLDTYLTLEYFENLGYKVYHTWQCEFEALKKENQSVSEFCDNLSFVVDSRYRLSESQILAEVQSGDLFGMCEVDLCTPDKYKEIFSEFQPITKHAQISKEDIGPTMKDFAEQHGLLKRPTKSLLNSYFAEKILVATPLLQWYLKHGISCTRVHQVIQYKPKKCFAKFGESVTEARRNGDVDSSKKIISDNAKLIGNSAYGRTLISPERHRDVSFHEVDESTIGTLINDKKFQGLTEISEDLVEIESAKSCIKHNVPIQIGFFVLELAKLILLRFYYDFLMRFLSFDSFCLIQCDTDSLYMSFSEPTLFLAIKPEARDIFVSVYDQWMAREYCDLHKADFFTTVFAGDQWNAAECCRKASKFYLRQPGLFHLENASKGVVALCSKSYYCFGTNPKYSSKGLSKRHNDLSEKEYGEVLLGQSFFVGKNRGIRVKDETMYTYSQNKRGLTYMYCKRIVSSDHVTTLPTKL